MIGEYLTRIQQFLILLWYFLTFKPVVEAAMEEELSVAQETLAQRLRRRWEHSKERVRQRQQKAACGLGAPNHHAAGKSLARTGGVSPRRLVFPSIAPKPLFVMTHKNAVAGFYTSFV